MSGVDGAPAVAAPGQGAAARAVGVDVGGTKVSAVLVGPAGFPTSTVLASTVLASTVLASTVLADTVLASVRGSAGVLDTVEAAVRAVCAQGGVLPGDLAAVGVGVPGLVDPRRGVVEHAVNLGVVERLALGPRLTERLGVPVRVENDLTVAALGAAATLGRGDLALLALGTGVAAGLVLDGVVRRGATGAAGEVGHLTYRVDGPGCRCGQRGCLELYASGPALTAAWSAAGGGRGTQGAHGPAAVFAAAQAGDEVARATCDAYGDAVAAAVRHLVLVADVRTVVIGGGVSGVGAPLLDAVRAALHRSAAGSAFLTHLDLPGRVELLDDASLVGPVGAASCAVAAVAGAEGDDRTEALAWRS